MVVKSLIVSSLIGAASGALSYLTGAGMIGSLVAYGIAGQLAFVMLTFRAGADDEAEIEADLAALLEREREQSSGKADLFNRVWQRNDRYRLRA